MSVVQWTASYAKKSSAALVTEVADQEEKKSSRYCALFVMPGSHQYIWSSYAKEFLYCTWESPLSKQTLQFHIGLASMVVVGSPSVELHI